MGSKYNFNLSKSDELAEGFIKILQKNIIADDKIHTGKLSENFSFRTDPTPTGIELSIFTEDYLKYVDVGRKARGPVIKKNHGFPPASAFLTYTNGNKQHAWAIAYKVYRDGIAPTNVIQRSLDEFLNSFEVPDFYIFELEKSLEDIMKFK